MARRALGLASCLILTLAVGCSGSSMEETGADVVVSEGTAVATTVESEDLDSDATDESDVEASADADEDGYLERLQTAVLADWAPPGRDSRTAARIAVVTVWLGPRGRLVRWDWRRRSPNTRFNRNVAEYLDGLVESPRQFPLPPAGRPLRRAVLEDGARVEFAESD